MPNSKVKKKQKENYEYACRWLKRAQKDFTIFEHLVPCNKDYKKVVPCTDPALSVYLLQQCVEKATKAVAAATGKYPYQKLKRHGHNSLVLLMDFYKESLSTILSKKPEFSIIVTALGIDIQDGLQEMIDFGKEASKTPKNRINSEKLYQEQYAGASQADIDKMLDFLLSIRSNAFIGNLRTIFGPHGKVYVDKQDLNTATGADFTNSLIKAVGGKLNIPQLSEQQTNALTSLINMMAPQGISTENDPQQIPIQRRKIENEQLGQWSLIALLFLAALTFPHESTARYPGPPKKNNIQPACCEDYNKDLGIVNRLGRMGYVTRLAISNLKPQLNTISLAYPLIES